MIRCRPMGRLLQLQSLLRNNKVVNRQLALFDVEFHAKALIKDLAHE